MQVNGNIAEMSSIQSGFNEVTWVLRARSTDPLRINIHNIHADNDFIVATDGHRLHLTENSMEFPAGEWKPIKVTKKEMIFQKVEDIDVEFPEYWRVMPMIGNPDRRRFSMCIKPKERGACLATPFFETLTYTQCKFNVDLLSDIFTLDGQWTLEQGPANAYTKVRPIVFLRNDDCLVILMPLKD